MTTVAIIGAQAGETTTGTFTGKSEPLATGSVTIVNHADGLA